jgi:hypothetical protein
MPYPWYLNFVLVLVANAAHWDIADALSAALNALVTAFQTTYTKHLQPDSGKVSTEQKSFALKVLKKEAQINSRYSRFYIYFFVSGGYYEKDITE